MSVVAIAVSPPQEPGRAPFALTAASHLYSARDSIVLDPNELILRQRMRRNGGTDLWLVRWPGTASGQVEEEPSSRLQPSR